MEKRNIEPGQRWGQLIVLEKAEPTPSGHSRWRCRCDCGKETVVLAGNLKQGRTVSCGCRREKNLAGQHIGRLMVLERSDRYASRGKRRVRLWKCQCDCGAITYRSTDMLTNSSVNMCRKCAEEYLIKNARAKAGFTQGTQLSRLTSDKGRSQNATGVRGVYLDRRTGRYRARIKFQGKLYNLGTYSSLEEAIAARQEGEKQYFESFLEEMKKAKGDISG